MKPGLALLLAVTALGGCRVLTFVGTSTDPDASRADAPVGADVDVDATSDVPHDVSPGDVGDGVDQAQLERYGLVPRGIGVIPDGVSDERSFRVAYLGEDGRVRVERRASESLARECERSFDPPADADLVAAPVVPYQRSELYVLGRERRSGALRYYALLGTGLPDTCGEGFGSWVALPELPAGATFRSAPGAVFLHAAPGGAAVWVAAVTGDSTVHLCERPVLPGAPRWASWIAMPPIPAGERIVSAPSVGVGGANTFNVGVLTEDASGRRRQRDRNFQLPERNWGPSWTEQDTGRGVPESEFSSVVFEVDPRYRQGAHPYAVWRLYRDQRGDVWAQVYGERRGFSLGWSSWTDLGAPFGDRVVKVGRVSATPRRNIPMGQGEVMVIAEPLSGPRSLRYLSSWFDTPEGSAARWTEVPDPLR
jgi:hypothetical protein